MSSNTKNSSNNSLPSVAGAGETPTKRDSAPSHTSATEPALPPPAAAGLENYPGGDEAPATPAQIGEDHKSMEGAMEGANKGSMERIEGDDDAPVPPAQTAAAYGEMERSNKKSVEQAESEDVPLSPSQIAASFEDIDRAIKQHIKDTNSSISGMDLPLPPSQMAALAEETEEDDEEYGSKIQATPTTEVDDNTPPPSLLARSPIVEQEETLQRARDPPIPALARASSPHPMDPGRNPSNPRDPSQIPVRPPPPSMMPSPDEEAGPPVSAVPRDPSALMLEATPVDEQVYDGVLVDEVAEQSPFQKNKKILIVAGMGILFGAAVAAGVSVNTSNGSNKSDASNPEEVVLATAPPLGSSSPSDVPSMTLRPSHSSNPSESPSLSFRPSLSPSISVSPTPFCFGGEINILTDSYPYETSWSISRIDDVDGVANSKVVLEGSPELGVNRTTSHEACLEKGDYEFAIFDAIGDGIFSPGYYMVTFDGVVIARGGEFGSEERVSFFLPVPSPPPSKSSSPSRFPSASFQPSESKVPSEFPSFRPSVQPSISFAPSQSSSPSLRPSISFSPSTYWSTVNWSRQGLGFNGDSSDDHFGRAVAFSADAKTMAVGAPGCDHNGEKPGYVKVYRREGEAMSWEQRGDTIHGEANGDNFGRSLALSEDGTSLAIGAPRHDSAGSNSGQVKVYEWDDSALNYVQIGDTLYGAASDDEFGSSLDLSDGKILAVGASRSDASGSDSGQVTIYAWDEASSNFKQRGEAIDGDAAYDWFGRSVSLSGNVQKLAVGAPYNYFDGEDSGKGKVRVFEWDEASSNYVPLGDSLLGDAAGDAFGSSVSFSRDGTTLAIGAFRSSGNGRKSGQVKVLAWDEDASNFAQVGQSLYGKAAEDWFGSSVALSSEGKTLAVGAFQFGVPGYAEVYGWDEVASEYKQLGQSLVGEAPYDRFGYALALAGNGRVLAVGAPYNDRNGTDSGRVEVFDIEN